MTAGQDEAAVVDDRRGRILQHLTQAHRPMDDDELSRATGIVPRQSVNQVCRSLAADEFIERFIGPDGKIQNRLAAHPATTAVNDEPESAARHRSPGHSGEQRAAERHMLRALGELMGLPLTPLRISLTSGVRVEVDGADADRTVLVECWAHIGGVKGAQRLKVLTDAFKLTWVADQLPQRPRLVLCFADSAAAAPFLNLRAWHGQALRDRGVEIAVVDLPDEVRLAVIAAQARQVR
jgi:hypothetical protein